MMGDETLLPMFERLLAGIASPAHVRAMESSGSIEPFWGAIEASGYLDLLTPEEGGGAGLTLAEAAPLIQSLGAVAAPAPVAETMVARARLWRARLDVPEGPIVLVAPVRIAGGLIARTPFGLVARHALVQLGDQLVLTRLTPEDGVTIEAEGGLTATLTWPGEPIGPSFTDPDGNLGASSAALRSIEIAGLAMRVLEMTVAYAGDRVQFGKPIGRQQAIQQSLAVMAEHAVAARMASQLGVAQARASDAAIAKYMSSKAAAFIADQAHAIFGAIGMSEEHDLQLYTRRLREWRLATGSETFWARHLGAAVLASSSSSLVDFVSR